MPVYCQTVRLGLAFHQLARLELPNGSADQQIDSGSLTNKLANGITDGEGSNRGEVRWRTAD